MRATPPDRSRDICRIARPGRARAGGRIAATAPRSTPRCRVLGHHRDRVARQLPATTQLRWLPPATGAKSLRSGSGGCTSYRPAGASGCGYGVSGSSMPGRGPAQRWSPSTRFFALSSLAPRRAAAGRLGCARARLGVRAARRVGTARLPIHTAVRRACSPGEAPPARAGRCPDPGDAHDLAAVNDERHALHSRAARLPPASSSAAYSSSGAPASRRVRRRERPVTISSASVPAVNLHRPVGQPTIAPWRKRSNGR